MISLPLWSKCMAVFQPLVSWRMLDELSQRGLPPNKIAIALNFLWHVLRVTLDSSSHGSCNLYKALSPFMALQRGQSTPWLEPLQKVHPRSALPSSKFLTGNSVKSSVHLAQPASESIPTTYKKRLFLSLGIPLFHVAFRPVQTWHFFCLEKEFKYFAVRSFKSL